jgi:hypothetical protein
VGLVGDRVSPGIEELAVQEALLRYFLSENHRGGVRHRMLDYLQGPVPIPQAPVPPPREHGATPHGVADQQPGVLQFTVGPASAPAFSSS